MNGEVLFDARDAASLLVIVLVAVALAIIGIIAIFSLRGRWGRGGDRELLERAQAVVILAVIAAVLVAAAAPSLIGLWARKVMSSGRLSVNEGCVQNFERVVHVDNHSMADTYFTVGGRDFHFNSVALIPGFHNNPNMIRPGEGLRITLNGETVLRIERAAGSCPGVDHPASPRS